MKSHRPKFSSIIWISLMFFIQTDYFSASTPDSVSTQKSWISPPNPKYNEPIHIFYRKTPDIHLNASSHPQVLMNADLLDSPESIEMKKENALWKAAVSINDTGTKAVFYILQYQDTEGNLVTDDNDGQYWDFLLHDQNSNPVPGAFQAKALSHTGFGGKRTENLEQASTEIEQEIALYPENYQAKQLKYTILLRKTDYAESVRQQIQKEIETLLKQKPDNKAVSDFAVNAYRMIGQIEKADRVEKKLIETYPESHQAGMNKLEEILKIESPEVRIEQLEQFLSDYPNSAPEELVLSQLASAMIEVKDTTKIIDIGDQLLLKSTTLSGASGLVAIAGVLSEKGKDLDRAIAYTEKALDLTQSFDSSAGPPEISPQEWKEQLQKTEARYRDILGWSYFQKGNTLKALEELQYASQRIHQPNVYYHLGKLFEKTAEMDSAQIYYGRAALFDDEVGDIAYERLSTIWKDMGGDETEMEKLIQQQGEWLKEKQHEKILSKGSIRPAPDFKLKEIEGEQIQLSDQEESVVVLCFWASWSKASGYILNMLEDLAQTYGQDVLFITIATDLDQSTLEPYLRKHEMIFPVLMNDGTDKAYGLHGVPTLFIIDAKGNIQFEHRGYNPNLLNTLAIELDALLGK